MVEAGSHLKLLPTFILDTYKVFEHIDMLSIVQRGMTWGATHRTGGRYNEGVDFINGGMCIDGDQGDQNGGCQEANPDV